YSGSIIKNFPTTLIRHHENRKVNTKLVEPSFRTDSVVGTDGPAIKLVLKWGSRIKKSEISN
ncbi:MAG: hypothetical protein QOA70_00500, partial [Nitrososphaeraceae archaeon]|nr:hypothetical protein [Nitrososphaeraceae archaeon]